MMYCATCSIDLTGVEIETPSQCPMCENEIRTIKSQKLIELMRELNNAVINLNNKDGKHNPKKLGEFVKLIDKGERSFNKEYTKRIEHLKEIEYELSVITKFTDSMGYTLDL